MNQENFVLVSHKSFFYRLKEAVGKYSALYEKDGNGFAQLHHATQQKRKNRKAKAPPSADGSSSDGNVTTLLPAQVTLLLRTLEVMQVVFQVNFRAS